MRGNPSLRFSLAVAGVIVACWLSPGCRWLSIAPVGWVWLPQALNPKPYRSLLVATPRSFPRALLRIFLHALSGDLISQLLRTSAAMLARPYRAKWLLPNCGIASQNWHFRMVLRTCQFCECKAAVSSHAFRSKGSREIKQNAANAQRTRNETTGLRAMGQTGALNHRMARDMGPTGFP